MPGGEDYGYYDSPYADDADTTAPRLTPESLGTRMRLGTPVPELLDGLIYPGRLHSISAPPESGKTILCLAWAISAMRRGGSCLHVDEESGPVQTAGLLSALGAEPELVDKRYRYIGYPAASWRGRDLTELDQLIGDERIVLSVWDSAAALMAAAGLDENNATDCNRFYSVLLSVSRRHECAVVVVDHDAKSGEGGRYSRGSGAKLASCDVAFKITPVRHFSRHQDGLLRFRIAKDREGHLHRDWRVRVTRNPLAVTFIHDVPDQPAGGHGMSAHAQKLAAVLTDEPATVQQIVDLVNASFGHGIPWAAARQELASLVAQGVADSVEEPGRYPMWLRAGAPKPAERTWRPTGQ